MAAKTMTMKMKHHRTEITRGDNGGLTVKHSFKMDNDGDEYPRNVHSTSNVYGPDQHDEAMKDVMSTCCDGGLGKDQPGFTKGHGKQERETMHEARKKVGSHLATLGGKNKVPAPEKTVA